MILRRMGLLLLWLGLSAGCRRTPTVAPPPPADAGARPDGAVPVGGELTIACDGEPSHLLWFVQPDVWIARIGRDTIFEGLLRRDANGKLVPSLAERWTRSPDGRTYDFVLRQGARFHDGQPVTVEDVFFTLDAAGDARASGAATREALEGIEGWESIGPHGLRIRFRFPRSSHALAFAWLPILPKHVYGSGDPRRSPGARAPIGSGPYRLERWTRGRELVLARFPEYWGAKPPLDRIVFRFERNRAATLEALDRGAVDLLWRVLPSETASRSDLQRISYPSDSLLVLPYNTRRLASARLRRALAHLLDRKRLLAASGGAARTLATPYGPGHPAFDASLQPLSYDPPAAARLLDEEGYTDSNGDGVRDRRGRPLRLTFLATAGSRLAVQAGALWQEAMRSVGVTLDVVSVPWAVWLDRMHSGTFDVTLYGAALGPDRDLRPLLHSQATREQNYGGYSSPAVDGLLDEIRATLDVSARTALERKLGRLLSEDQPVLFLAEEAPVALAHRRVGASPAALAGNSVRELFVRP